MTQAAPPRRSGPLGAGGDLVDKSAQRSPTRDELVLRNIDVVKTIAGRLSRRLPAWIETADLISVGMLGLLDAAGRYRHDRGVRFDVFARRRVLGAMLDELRSIDRVPRATRRMSREVQATVRRLQHELGRQPTDTEVADAMNLSQEEYLRAVDQLRGLGSGTEHDLDVTDDSCQGLIAFKRGDCERPDTQLERTETRELLADARARLPEREQKIMHLYYEKGLTLKEISDVIGVSESRVSQLRGLAVARLRVDMREALGK